MIGRDPADLKCFRLMAYLALIGGAFGLGVTQGGPAVMPENPFAKSNENGWQSNCGYREVGRVCVSSGMPIAPAGETCCGTHSVNAREAVDFEGECARLRAIIDDLSIKNAILRSERDDDAR